MSEPRLSYIQLYDAARALYLGKRHWIEVCAAGKGYAGRPEHWFTEQRHALAAVEQIGVELRTIAANADLFDAWKAGLTA